MRNVVSSDEASPESESVRQVDRLGRTMRTAVLVACALFWVAVAVWVF